MAFGTHQPLLSWHDYVTTHVRDMRVLALSGRTSFSDGKHRIDHAVGVLELIGGQQGDYRTTLQICFSDALSLPPPAFMLADSTAVGTLTLPGRWFEPYIEIAQAQGAHFRIGGDGSRNALAAQAALLN
ncbi:MAG: hypothetical protein EOO33_08110 [Comamonadaceae bacterium]|nr:MAG: hypothetical protein EOO33_08110 [Comamonadaceae bacterium]